jgi:hypothetical protein
LAIDGRWVGGWLWVFGYWNYNSLITEREQLRLQRDRSSPRETPAAMDIEEHAFTKKATTYEILRRDDQATGTPMPNAELTPLQKN